MKRKSPLRAPRSMLQSRRGARERLFARFAVRPSHVCGRYNAIYPTRIITHRNTYNVTCAADRTDLGTRWSAIAASITGMEGALISKIKPI